jgi:hypothetical protein
MLRLRVFDQPRLAPYQRGGVDFQKHHNCRNTLYHRNNTVCLDLENHTTLQYQQKRAIA